jgi:hypothetical protein
MSKEIEKKSKQTSLDLGSYIDQVEKNLREGTKGKITLITPITNTKFFKELGKFDEKDGIAVNVKTEDDTEFSQWFSIPQAQGYYQSNLYKFKQKYRDIPRLNMEVEVFIDENGFYRIKV